MRRSSGSRAFTFVASDGRGVGSVLTQWFTRKSGAPSGPRLGSQVAASPAGSMSGFAPRKV